MDTNAFFFLDECVKVKGEVLHAVGFGTPLLVHSRTVVA